MSSENTSIDFTLWDQEFEHLYRRLVPHFGRVEVRARVRRYLLGLLSPLARKNSWALAEHMQEGGPQGMQRLLNTAHWDVDAVRDSLRAYVLEHLGEPEGLLVLDETGFLKKGHSLGGRGPAI
jgi:SRSO17 transposase